MKALEAEFRHLDRHFLAHSSQNFTWCRISWDKIFLHEYFVFRFYLASYQVLTSTFLIPLELRNVLPQAPKTNTTLCRWLPIHLDLTCCPSVPIQAWDLRTKLEITTTATKRYTWKIAFYSLCLFCLKLNELKYWNRPSRTTGREEISKLPLDYIQKKIQTRSGERVQCRYIFLKMWPPVFITIYASLIIQSEIF